MKIEKKIHPALREISGCIDGMGKGKPPLLNWVGKYQYIYSDNGNKISLVELLSPRFGLELDEKTPTWEIMCIGGKQLFEDVERFPTKEEAEERIKEVMANAKNNER